MVKRILLGLAVVGILAGGVYYVKTRYFTEEEDRVRAVVDTLIVQLESDNVTWSVLRIRDLLSEKYRHHGEGAGGAIGKAFALRFVTGLKQQSAGLKAEISKMTVFVSGDTAKVDITGRVMARQRGEAGKWAEVMTKGGKNRVIIELEKEDGDWMVVGSQRLSHKLTESTKEN